MHAYAFVAVRSRLIMTALVQLILAILSAAVDGSEVTQLTAIATDSITISCDDFSSNAPQSVEWLSDAWSTSHDLVTIFRSNPNFDVMSSHVNAKNYEVDRQYRLTIVKVNKKEDPGKYICRITTSTGDVLDREYHLDVGDKPWCGATDEIVEPGGQTKLTCNMSFSGNKPEVTWFAGDEELQGDDNSDVGIAQHDFTRSVTIDDDRRPFRCVTRLGDLQQVCEVVVEVPHSAQAVRLTPSGTVIQVGAELKCSARGNPTPGLTFSPATAQQRDGHDGSEAWKTMVVPSEWQDQNHTVTCTAVNEVGNKRHEVTTNATFQVIPAAAKARGGAGSSLMQSATRCGTVVLLLSSICLTLITVQ